MNEIPKSGSAEISELLQIINNAGGFPITILTDRHGFPIASAAAPSQDPEKQAAVVALVQKTASQVTDQLGMAQTDEISIFDKEGQKLVCRPFDANGHNLILAVVVPNKDQSYRRLTNKAVRDIRQMWKL